jgi:prophage antirepressor-like protein
MNAPSVFSFDSSISVRALAVDGEPWFVASDIATALGYTNPQKAVRDHCKRAKSLSSLDGTIRSVQQNQDLDPKTKLIPEPDVYRLIVRSKLPSAEAFETWLFETVIPSIRKTGGYQTGAAQDYERITDTQYRELANAITLSGWLFHGADKRLAAQDRVRATFNIRHLRDLPANQFDAAILLTKDIQERADIVHRAVSEYLNELTRNYIAAGAPCTPVMVRESRKFLGCEVPPRPDWIEVQRQITQAKEQAAVSAHIGGIQS